MFSTNPTDKTFFHKPKYFSLQQLLPIEKHTGNVIVLFLTTKQHISIEEAEEHAHAHGS